MRTVNYGPGDAKSGDIDKAQLGCFHPNNHLIFLGQPLFMLRKQSGDGSCFFHSYLDFQEEVYPTVQEIQARVMELRDMIGKFITDNYLPLKEKLGDEVGEILIQQILDETKNYDSFTSLDCIDIFSVMIQTKIVVYQKDPGSNDVQVWNFPDKFNGLYSIDQDAAPFCIFFQTNLHFMLLKEIDEKHWKKEIQEMNHNYYVLCRSNIDNEKSMTFVERYPYETFFIPVEQKTEIQRIQGDELILTDKDPKIKILRDVNFHNGDLQNWMEINKVKLWVRKQVSDGNCLLSCVLDHMNYRGENANVLINAMDQLRSEMKKLLEEKKQRWDRLWKGVFKKDIKKAISDLNEPKAWLSEINLDLLCVMFEMEIDVYMNLAKNTARFTFTRNAEQLINFRTNRKMVLLNQENLHWMLLHTIEYNNPNFKILKKYQEEQANENFFGSSILVPKQGSKNNNNKVQQNTNNKNNIKKRKNNQNVQNSRKKQKHDVNQHEPPNLNEQINNQQLVAAPRRKSNYYRPKRKSNQCRPTSYKIEELVNINSTAGITSINLANFGTFLSDSCSISFTDGNEFFIRKQPGDGSSLFHCCTDFFRGKPTTIKEIKSRANAFRRTVFKFIENNRKAVNSIFPQEVIGDCLKRTEATHKKYNMYVTFDVVNLLACALGLNIVVYSIINLNRPNQLAKYKFPAENAINLVNMDNAETMFLLYHGRHYSLMEEISSRNSDLNPCFNLIYAKKIEKEEASSQELHIPMQTSDDSMEIVEDSVISHIKKKQKRRRPKKRRKSRKLRALEKLKKDVPAEQIGFGNFNAYELQPPQNLHLNSDEISMYCPETDDKEVYRLYSVPYLVDSFFYALIFDPESNNPQFKVAEKEVKKLKDKIISWCNVAENKKEYSASINKNIKNQIYNKCLYPATFKLVALALNIVIRITSFKKYWQTIQYPSKAFVADKKNKSKFENAAIIELFQQGNYFRRAIYLDPEYDTTMFPQNPIFASYLQKRNHQKLIEQYLQGYIKGTQKCSYCKVPGHNKANCFLLQKRFNQLSEEGKQSFEIKFWEPVENLGPHEIVRAQKCSLNKLIPDNNDLLIIDEMAIVVQQIKNVASIFCYIIIIKKLIDFEKLKKLSLEDIKGYFRKIWRITYKLDNNNIAGEVIYLNQLFDQWGFQRVMVDSKFTGISRIMEYVVDEYITNMTTLLKIQGWKYIKWSPPPEEQEEQEEGEKQEEDDVQEEQDDQNEPNDDVDDKLYTVHMRNPFTYLEEIIDKGLQFEQYYREKGRNRFKSVIPLYLSQIPGYFRISPDTWNFLNVHQPSDFLDERNRTLQKKGFERSHLMTDGVSCSVIFKANIGASLNKIPQNKNKKEVRYGYQDENIIADDPGVTTIVHATNCQEMESTRKNNRKKIKQFKYTAKQKRDDNREEKSRKFEAASIQSDERTKREQDDLSEVTHRTFDPGKFDLFVVVKLRTFYNPFWYHTIWRLNRMRNWMSKASGEAKMLERLKDTFDINQLTKDDKIFAVGSWALSKGQLPGHGPVLKAGFMKLIHNLGIKVLMVGEYNTSRMCSVCKDPDARLHHPTVDKRRTFLDKNGDLRSCSVPHGLLKCNTCNRYWDRNQNAAQNIHFLASEWLRSRGSPLFQRPTYLSPDDRLAPPPLPPSPI